ncbi:MAG: sensor histidine kinase, partial [Gammaproteobacteria bacterium]|nr:sensor histidine kinase [Gammaproteobacteria bacterium]
QESTDKPPKADFTMKSSPTFSNTDYLRLLKHLSHEGHLSLGIFYPAHHTWVTYSLYQPHDPRWIRSLFLLSTGLLIVALLWVLFFVYYRSILPQELLSLMISGGENNPDSTIEKLKTKITEYYQEKNLMLSALSHDIKTPLTEAMLQLELLEDQSVAASIRHNLERINRIINTSLEYSRAPGILRKSSTDLVPMLKTLCLHYQNKGFPVSFTSSLKTLPLPIESDLFHRMMVNLLDNAQRYASQSTITLKVQKKNTVLIEVTDNGPGVPNAVLKKLGTPYFRVDPSRSSQTGNTGLGLAIVKKIAEMHEGSVSFKNSPEGGFRVVLKFPLHIEESLSEKT